jgi:hypothetical protein
MKRKLKTVNKRVQLCNLNVVKNRITDITYKIPIKPKRKIKSVKKPRSPLKIEPPPELDDLFDSLLIPNMQVDIIRSTATLDGQTVKLSQREFSILHYIERYILGAGQYPTWGEVYCRCTGKTIKDENDDDSKEKSAIRVVLTRLSKRLTEIKVMKEVYINDNMISTK